MSRISILRSYAAHDVLKSKGLFFLIVISMGVAFTAMITTASVLEGFSNMLSEGAIGWLGDIVIQPAKDDLTIKNIDKAQEQLKILKELRTLASDNYKRIAGVYAARGYYKEAEELLLEGITHFPNATILYSSMADVYAKDGKIVEARKAAEKAVEIDPSFKDEADVFIKELESTVPAKKK